MGVGSCGERPLLALLFHGFAACHAKTGQQLASEPKTVHAGTTPSHCSRRPIRVFIGPWHPGRGDVEAVVERRHFGIQSVEEQVGRDDAVLHGQRRLHDPGNAGCALGMANDGLD